MKKSFFSISVLALSAMLSGTVMFSSCGSDNDDNDGDGNGTEKPIDPEKPDDKTAMSPQEQKEYLETVAKEFMNTVPSNEFKNLADLGKHISDVYMDQYEWDTVEDWADDIFDELRIATGTTDKEKDDWGYNCVYTNYKALIMASNFTGHFTARDGKWTLTKANDLQFIFNDKNGSQCVLKLETSGNVKKVHMFDIDDWTDWDYDSYTDYYDRTAYTVGLPENIVVTLTRGGSNVVKTAVKIDLSGITSEEFDLSKNSLSLSCNTELENGYKIEMSKVAYAANNNASATAVLSKNGKSLATVAIASDITGIPSYNAGAFGNFDEDDFDKANAKNAFAKIDILGKVQIQGKISDVRKFFDYIDFAEDNDESESLFKSYINQANALIDFGLFYDGKNTKQADIKLEPFMDDYGYYKDWYNEPVIKFFDGSSYSTFEAFFNDTDFKSVIDTFEDLADEYADLFNF